MTTVDHESLLALIAELYGSVSRLTADNAALRRQVEDLTAPPRD